MSETVTKNTFGLPVGRTLHFQESKTGKISDVIVYFVDDENNLYIHKPTKGEYKIDLLLLKERFDIKREEAKKMEAGKAREEALLAIAQHEVAATARLKKVYKLVKPAPKVKKENAFAEAVHEAAREQSELEKEFARLDRAAVKAIE